MGSDEKDLLELKKLALEVAELERPWWKRPSYILASLPTLLAVVALTVGFLNGFFSAQLTKLENQRHDLEAQVNEFEAKRDQLHKQNAAIGVAASHYAEGLVHFWALEKKEAVAEYTKAIEADPTFSWAYYDRGLTISQMDDGDKNAAIADLTKAIELNPSYAKAYYFRGFTYHSQRNYNRALVDYNKAIELDPLFADTYANRALIFDQMGETEKAEADRRQFNALKQPK